VLGREATVERQLVYIPGQETSRWFSVDEDFSIQVGRVAFGMGRLARVKIGGFSGDVLGANQQIAEIVILLLGAAVVHEDWGTLAWWSQ
jgi:hypothetical protein